MICEANYIGTEFFSTHGKAIYKKRAAKPLLTIHYKYEKSSRAITL